MILMTTTVAVRLCSQCKNIEDPMPVCDCIDLDRWLGAKFTDGVCTAGSFCVRRLAVLPERQSVKQRDARV